MVNYLYESLYNYFNHLCNTGYTKYTEVEKLLLLSAIHRLVDCDFRGYLNEEDYNNINKALYSLYGTSCLIPYPDYYSNKNKRIMYTCSISELAHRVDQLENNGGSSSGGTNETRVNELIDIKLVDIKNRIDNIEDKDIVVSEVFTGNISGLVFPEGVDATEYIHNLEDRLDSAINALKSKVTNIEGTQDELSRITGEHSTNITNILNSINTINQTIGELNTKINDKADTESVNASIENLQNQIDFLVNNPPSGLSSDDWILINNAISSVQSNLDTLQTNLESVEVVKSNPIQE